MRTRVTLQILREIEAFRLRYTCDDCAHFDARGERCAHGYPLGERKRALHVDDEIVFCKEFEG
jgi:hypothetical protein